jgi:hypothetical protein
LARVIAATTILCAVGGFLGVRAWYLSPRPPVALLGGMVFISVTVLGLVTGRWWGRWLGLAMGVFCCLFVSIEIVSEFGEGFVRPKQILAAIGMGSIGPLLLACLSGRTMFERYDQPAGHARGARPALARWAAITNVSSLVTLGLVSSVMLDPHGPEVTYWKPALACLLLILAGVVLLARGKTVGLLLAFVGALAEVGVLASVERSSDRPIIATLLAPGFVFSVAAAVAYAAPMWRFLRGR